MKSECNGVEVRMRKYSTRGGWDFGNRLKCKGDIKAILDSSMFYISLYVFFKKNWCPVPWPKAPQLCGLVVDIESDT